LALLFLLAGCAWLDTHRVGNFELRKSRQHFGGHSSGTIALHYRGIQLAEKIGDWSVDPRNPDRIIYTSSGNSEPCGTFFYDGRSGADWKMSSRRMGVHPASDDSPEDDAGTETWSPDGRYVYAGNETGHPVVFDLIERREFDLTDAVSIEGRRLEMDATLWSPDSRRIAVEIAPNGYNGDRDLATVTLSPLRAEYVASMTGSLPLWTTTDYYWSGELLVVRPTTKYQPVFSKTPKHITWTSSPPSARAASAARDCQ
jgi:hypothetical protein